jgi:ribosomal protein S18 acetylase RimI-like enzyme
MPSTAKDDDVKIPLPKYDMEEVKTSAQFHQAFPVLIQLLWSGNLEEAFPLEEETSYAQYQESRKQGYRLFVAKTSLEVLGVAGIRVCHDPLNLGAPYALLNNLVVEEDFRGLGIGQDIISRIEKLMKAEKVAAIFLNSPKSNKSGKKIYEGLGYSIVSDLMIKEI